MLKFLAKWWRWLWVIDAVEPSEYRIDDPHDPQHITRIVYDDDFIQLERPQK